MLERKPTIVRNVTELRNHVQEWRRVGEVIGIVPTMGALHEGHFALVNAAKYECNRVIVSIFVNPIQFSENEDLDTYPRGENEDLTSLGKMSVDLAFLPNISEIYPEGFATKVHVEHYADVLCGVNRPVHFGGVATVVSKLFNQSRADRAYFGEKDYQQYLVVRRMARDLDIPIEVVAVPTIREKDGLALSSRNVYLSSKERQIAPALNLVIKDVAAQIADGIDPGSVVANGLEMLDKKGFDKVEYLEALDAETLGLINYPVRPARIFVAAFLGNTRLIDNVPVRGLEVTYRS